MFIVNILTSNIHQNNVQFDDDMQVDDEIVK